MRPTSTYITRCDDQEPKSVIQAVLYWLLYGLYGCAILESKQQHGGNGLNATLCQEHQISEGSYLTTYLQWWYNVIKEGETQTSAIVFRLQMENGMNVDWMGGRGNAWRVEQRPLWSVERRRIDMKTFSRLSKDKTVKIKSPVNLNLTWLKCPFLLTADEAWSFHQ